MSDTIEPIAKRLRERSSRTVPHASPSTSNTPASSDTHENDASQNQPPNSMQRLSDVCLEKLFEHLDVATLSQLANVCKRFRKIAEKVFGQHHKEFVFKGYHCKNSVFRRVLCKFGHLITSIDASEAYFDHDQQIDTDAIVKYCPTKLEKLRLQQATINCASFKPLFARLTQLDLDGCDFVGNKNTLFTNCSKLENMYFDAKDSCGFVAQKYPKLKGLAFDCSYPGFFTFFDLLAQNPQLKYIHAMAIAEDIYISSVVQYTKNVERLMIKPSRMASTPEEQSKKVFLQLAKLKKLKKLALDVGYESYAELVAPLMDAFVKANVALDELDLRDFEISSKDIKAITEMKTLEALALAEIKNVTNADLISMTTKLPLLRDLQLNFGYESEAAITADGITKMVKAAKKLYFLVLTGIRNLKIDQKGFEALLKAVQSRGTEEKLTIQITGNDTTTSFNVPQNIQQASIKQLEIWFESEE